jgi:hypothetical protein
LDRKTKFNTEFGENLTRMVKIDWHLKYISRIFQGTKSDEPPDLRVIVHWVSSTGNRFQE